MALHIINAENPPWYSEGLPFKCTGCGQCCTGGPGYVWVTEAEILTMAQALQLTLDNFADRYLRRVGDRYSLREDPRTYDCVFLKDNRCQLYAERPLQCRTFPWWVQNLRSQEEWDKAASYCEGINHAEGRIVPCSEIQAEVAQMEGRGDSSI